MTTSGFRKQHGQDVYLWNPGAPYGTEDTGNTKTHRFNPLDLIPRDQLLRVDAIQKIWDIFFPKSMDKGQIWGPSARSLALGLSVYLMDHGERFTFGEIRRIVNITSNFELFLETLLKRHFDEGENFSLDLVCVINFNEFLQKAEKERSGVVSTLNSALEIWANPFVDAATSASDFDIRDLRRKRMSIYLGITPGNIKRFAPLMNMFFQQVISVMTEHEPKTDEPYTALLAIDEFPLLGKMDILKDGVAFLRSYRVKPMFVCQSKSQISEIYGDHGSQSMFQNCKTKNAFVPNDIKEAKEISEQLGKKTVVTYSRTYTNAGIGQGSLSKSYTSRELMKPDEVMRFTKHKSILLVENTRPIKVKKVQWFKDKNFKSRVIEPSPIPLINVDKFRAEIEKDINPELKLAFEESQKNKDGKPASLKDLSPDDAKALSEFI